MKNAIELFGWNEIRGWQASFGLSDELFGWNDTGLKKVMASHKPIAKPSVATTRQSSAPGEVLTALSSHAPEKVCEVRQMTERF
jgi:hypothetical protein